MSDTPSSRLLLVFKTRTFGVVVAATAFIPLISGRIDATTLETKTRTT
jgi:hypothetical protein